MEALLYTFFFSVNHINPDDPVNSHTNLGFWPQAYKNIYYE